jgi:hypothetical protein
MVEHNGKPQSLVEKTLRVWIVGRHDNGVITKSLNYRRNRTRRGTRISLDSAWITGLREGRRDIESDG